MRRLSLGGLLVASVAACGGLAHPVSNDGNDVTNPRTPTLSLSADRTDLGVGDIQLITATYNGAVLNGGGTIPPTSTVSDPGVIAGGAFSATALSVGGAMITATYQGSTAAIGFTVHSQYGLAAIIGAYTNALTGESAWLPSSVRVQAGSTVQFNIASMHNVVFDAVPGAPANIAVGATGAAGIWRQFPTAGSFTYRCTIHGEAGLINVTP